MTAIVFNCAYNGLNIIQELGRRGVDVYAFDSFRNIGTVSRYATYRSCPNAATSEEEFIAYLLSIADDFDDNPVLIPTNDHWAAAIAHHREKLSEHYRPCVASGETVDLVLNKDSFGKWAEERNYPVPRSWEGTNSEKIPADAFPIAAKPSDATSVPDLMFDSKVAILYNKFFGDDSETDLDPEEQDRAERLSKTRLEVLESSTELNEFVQRESDILNHFVFQEYVRGMSDSMYTVGVYANHGEVKGMFTGRKVRGYPPDIGDCKVGQEQSVPDHLIEDTTAICDDLDYHGIAEFEFKRDTETGEYYLIEINPRSWSWIGITPNCSANLPWIAYSDLSTDKMDSVQESESAETVKWVKVTEDLPNCLFGYRWRGFDDWDLTFQEWKQSIQADHVEYAELSRDDPVPGAYSMVLLLRRGATGLLNTVKNRYYNDL